MVLTKADAVVIIVLVGQVRQNCRRIVGARTTINGANDRPRTYSMNDGVIVSLEEGDTTSYGIKCNRLVFRSPTQTNSLSSSGVELLLFR